MEKIKSSYNNNKFKTSARTWDDEFKLPDGSYLVSDIQDYFEYILAPETLKLHRSTESTNDENISDLEITEVVLVHWNIASNDYQQD